MNPTCVRRWVLALMLLALGTHSASAQSGTATLSGTITDESGAVVPDAQVTLTNDATQLRLQKTSGSAGLFAFALLPRGRYVLTAERSGFSPTEVRDLVLNVEDQLHITVTLKVATVGETVTVAAEPHRINTSPALATVVDRQFVENLPLNGRSFQSLLAVVPGVVFTGQSSPGNGQFSVNGQRTNANYYTVDGVGANVEAGGASWPGSEVSGVTPAINALGGTQSLVSADALEEFSIQTSTYSAKFGRQAGGQVSLVTRAGTNQFHGSAFEYFRDDALDAVDWFVKANNLPRTPLRQNQFGGTFGGPVRMFQYDGRGRTFFFASYEGLRLLQPRTISASVPSLSFREEAWPGLRPLLASLPIPTGPENPETRQAPFVAAYSAPSSFDATSVRIDQHVSPSARLFGRFNYSPSKVTTRTLNNVSQDSADLRTVTLGLTQTFGASITHDLRFNDTSNRRPLSTWQDDFGGATPISVDALRPPGIPATTPVRLQVHLFGVASPYYTEGQFQRQHQLNIVDTWTWTKGSHLVNIGVDYRQLRPASQPYEYFYFFRFSAAALLSGIPSEGSISSLERVDLRFHNLSAFVSDSWRVTPRLTLDAGLRWEVNPTPTMAGGKSFVTILGLEQPETLHVAPEGTPIYPTDYSAFGPRLGAAYVVSDRAQWERTIRGGFGLFYDLAFGEGGRAALHYPFAASRPRPAIPYPFDAAAVAPPSPPPPGPPFNNATFIAFPDHKTPLTYEWNVSVEQSLGRSQSVTASYVGALGRHLLRREQYVFQDPNVDFTGATNIEVSASNATSDYAALQLQYRRRLSKGLQALASYTLSKAEDTVSNAIITQPRSDRFDSRLFAGPSDFDRRHIFSAALTYDIPARASGVLGAVARDWSVATILQMQSALPVNITIGRDLGAGAASTSRPDRVPGVPLVLDDATAPGGWRINPAAFSVPSELRMGDLPRNALRGFPLRQIDLSISRQLPLAGRAKAHVRVDAFNVFNIPNFSNPSGYLGLVSADGVLTPSASFGVPSSQMDSTLGGINGIYRLHASGGPRSVQLSARLTF